MTFSGALAWPYLYPWPPRSPGLIEAAFDELAKRWRPIFDAYDEAVAELDGIDPVARDPRDTHARHLYVVRVDPERAGATRDDYQRALADENIGTSIHFLPVHELTAYRDVAHGPLPVSERAGAEVLSLPLSPAHSDDDVRDAIDALRRVHGRFARC